MPLFDLPVRELERYLPTAQDPPDFDAFWSGSIAEARQHELDVRWDQPEVQLALVETYDVTFAGWAGQPIKGWLSLPVGVQGRLPCIVEYLGYGGGRGFSFDWTLWPSAGYAHFVMDTRGQGSGWRRGDTPDVGADGAPSDAGWMTRGIRDPSTYYYRRVFVDAVRAVEAARAHPRIDPARVGVMGGSQGGGISLAVAGLDDLVAFAMPDVPFLCDFSRAIGISGGGPYQELVKYLSIHRDQVERVLRTLSYFDGAAFAARAKAPALFSVGMMDAVCPPSTVYGAYNRYGGPKRIVTYGFNGHEGGDSYQTREKLAFLRTLDHRAPA